MSNGHGRTTRLLAGGVVGLSALAFVPSPAGAAISTAAFCANVADGSSGFTDLALAGVHADNVECLKASGVTAGTSPTTYSPQQNVSRGQMGSFIANMIDRANALDAPGATAIPDLPTAAASDDAFTDDETSVHENNINRLAEAGIISGTSATTFSPSANVSRGQMGSFIAQALAFVRQGALPEGSDAFTDDETSVHEANINRLANADIVDGTSATTYSPDALVSRAQMGSFIIQSMADLHADGFITPIAAAAGQAEFTSTPAGEQLVQLTPLDTGGARDFTFNLGAAGLMVDVALFDCGDSGEGPAVIGTTFRDIDGNAAGLPDSEADDIGGTWNGTAEIISTNGDPQGPGATMVDNYTSLTSSLVVRVNSMGSDCAFVAVFADTNDDDELDLAPFTPSASTGVRGYRAPTEDFGVAGPVVWHHGEAENGNDMEDGVLYVNRDANFWVDDFFSPPGDQGDRFNYGRANDRYFLDCFSDPLEINQADFEEFLTVGDNTSDDNASYNRAGPNQFENEDDYPLVPAGMTFQVGDFDATPDTALNDVRFTFNTTNPGGDVDTYWVDAFTAAGAGTAFFAESTPEGTTATITDLGPGNYLFRGYAESECSNFSGYTDPVAATISAPPVGNVPGDPLSSAAVAQDKDSSATLNAGDVLTVTFNELMAAPTAGDSITVSDPDGTTATITNGLNATFALGTQANQLVITMTAGPTITVVGGTIGVQYPATVTASSGNVDADEANEWDIAGSGDVIL